MSNKKQFKPLDPDDQKKRMGERLKQLRKKMGYTSAEKFANDHDFSRPTYMEYEQGKSEFNIEFNTLLKLANSYKVSLKEFFNEGFD
jgi:transcriptional regulator with XRE-family HTH domain